MSNSEVKQRQIIIFGSGGHAVSVANVAISSGYSVNKFIDSRKGGEKLVGIDIVASIFEVIDIEGFDYAIGIGDNFVRSRIFYEIIGQFRLLNFPALIHRSACISEFCSIGYGTVVMPNAVVGPNTEVGRFCIINTQASIDHDGTMCDFSSLAPGVVTGGAVTIGVRSAISIGATIKHAIKIGADVVVGASSYVNKSLDHNLIAYGTPARVVRSRAAGAPYLD